MNKLLAILTVALFLSVAQVSAAYHNIGVDIDADASADVGDVIVTDIETDVDVSAQSGISDSENDSRNRSNRTFRLSNGMDATIKIMPEVASTIAIQRLSLNACSAENNCTIMLKEVGNNDGLNASGKAAYEVQVEKEARVFGIFKKRMTVTAQIDAETGEVIEVRKPWWAGLAMETDVAASASGSAAYR